MFGRRLIWLFFKTKSRLHVSRYQSVNTALGAIFTPVQYKLKTGLLEPECDRWNQLARDWQDSGFNSNFFQNGACLSRRLEDDFLLSTVGNRTLTSERALSAATSVLEGIYTRKFAPLQKISDTLVVFKTIEENVKNIWLAGTKDAVLVLAEVIEFYQDVMDTLGKVMQAVLGPVIDVLGIVIDKVQRLPGELGSSVHQMYPLMYA